MLYTGATEDLKQLVSEKREELSSATKKAKKELEVILKFCYPKEESIFHNIPSESAFSQNALAKDYLFELLTAYIEGYPDREQRMQSFAENYQRSYEEVKEVLDYLGLEI